MKSNSALSLVAITIFSLIVGILISSWVLLILAVANLSILAAGITGSVNETIKLEVERETDEMSIYEGDEVWIRLSIKNEGESLRYIEMKDLLPQKTKVVEGSNHQILKIDKGEKKRMRYKISCEERGEIEIGPVKMRYRDPLDFNVEEWTSDKLMKLFVLPSIQELESVKVRPLYTKNWIGNIKSQSMGAGTEFFSLREYRPTDDMKRINWKATARQLDPVSNEFVGERMGDVILVIDGYENSNIGDEKRNTLNASIEAAGTLASSILADRNRVGLIILGESLSWLYPGSGRDHFYRIMEKLSSFEEGGIWKLSDTKWLLKRFFPERSMIIFISSLSSKRVSETIIDICMKGYNVMVLSPNPVDIETDLLDDYDGMAEKFSRLEREVMLEKLWKYSIVVDWDPNEPLERELEEVIRYWKRD